jgi:GNAT superfamily N-acetyltransferase
MDDSRSRRATSSSLDTVVPLARGDLTVAARVLATALADDPGYRHLMPDESRRVGELTALYQMILADAVVYGRGLVTRIGGVVTGALTIYPPGTYPMTAARWGRAAARTLRIAAQVREHSGNLIRFARLTAPAVPTDSWYFEALGVRPDLQGAGRGSALLAAALALVDAAGEPSYLETMNPGNVAYYERIGYERIREPVPLAADGPWIVPMLRPASAHSLGPR